MIETLRAHVRELYQINEYRKIWMFLSAGVVITVIGMIVCWDYIFQSKFIWFTTSMGLLISMVWWYWTMRLIRYLIHYKATEAIILEEIIREIRLIKQEVVKNYAPQETND